jgi:hypothetical protein
MLKKQGVAGVDELVGIAAHSFHNIISMTGCFLFVNLKLIVTVHCAASDELVVASTCSCRMQANSHHFITRAATPPTIIIFSTMSDACCCSNGINYQVAY